MREALTLEAIGATVAAGRTAGETIACPTCHARPGTRCARPSGHAAAQPHAARMNTFDAVFYSTFGKGAQLETETTPAGPVTRLCTRQRRGDKAG